MTISQNSGSEKYITFRVLSVTAGGECWCTLNMLQKLADQGITSGTRDKLANFEILQSKQVKRSSHEWINNFIVANLISGIISIIWLLDE